MLKGLLNKNGPGGLNAVIRSHQQNNNGSLNAPQAVKSGPMSIKSRQESNTGLKFAAAGGLPPKNPYQYDPTQLAQKGSQKQQKQLEAAKVTSGSAQVDDQVEQALIELNDLKSEAINSTGPNAPARQSILSKTSTSGFGGGDAAMYGPNSGMTMEQDSWR